MGKPINSFVAALAWVLEKIRYPFSSERRRYQCPACWHSWVPIVAVGVDRCPKCNYDLHLYNARRNAVRNRVVAVVAFLSIVGVALLAVSVVASGLTDSLDSETKQHSAVLPDAVSGPMDEFQETLSEEMRIREKYTKERDWKIPSNYWKTLNRVWMALSFQREQEELQTLDENKNPVSPRSSDTQ